MPRLQPKRGEVVYLLPLHTMYVNFIVRALRVLGTASKMSVFGVILVRISHIRDEYGETLRIFVYPVRIRKNTDQNNSEYGHFLRSDALTVLRHHRLVTMRKLLGFGNQANFINP